MNILVVTTDAYGSHGGIGLYNRDLIEAMSACPGVEQIVVVPRRLQYAPEAMPPNVRLVATPPSKYGFLRAVAQVAVRERVDFVVCGHVNLLPVAAAVAALRSVPLVVMAYGIEVWRPGSRLRRWLLKRVSAVWSISVVTQERMEAWAQLGGRYAILPNAIHLERYGVAPPNSGIATRYGLAGRKVILSFGRLAAAERYKGFDEILAVLPRMLQTEPNLVYVIGGGGDDLERLQNKVKALGLEDAVVFTGFVEEAEKADIYRLADAFVLAGRGEGFGFVLLEAMACGIPVVASILDGSFEAVRGGALGKAVNPDDEDALASAVLSAVAQPKEIPPGLEYFSFPAFCHRLYAELHRYLPGAARGKS